MSIWDASWPTPAAKKRARRIFAKARDLQNKTMEQTQQSVAADGGCRRCGAAAAIVPLNKQSENEAAPLLPASTDPFARVDASVMARANLTEKQRAAAESQENELAR